MSALRSKVRKLLRHGGSIQQSTQDLHVATNLHQIQNHDPMQHSQTNNECIQSNLLSMSIGETADTKLRVPLAEIQKGNFKSNVH